MGRGYALILSNSLTTQYELLRTLFDYPEAVPPAVDLNKVSAVLDIAAGTAAWTLDLANEPKIKPRLPPTSSNPVKLYACDLSLAKFPPKEKLDALGVTCFQQDVTQPFPQELRGKFDLAHMSLLVFALTEEGWDRALRNIYEVLST